MKRGGLGGRSPPSGSPAPPPNPFHDMQFMRSPQEVPNPLLVAACTLQAASRPPLLFAPTLQAPLFQPPLGRGSLTLHMMMMRMMDTQGGFIFSPPVRSRTPYINEGLHSSNPRNVWTDSENSVPLNTVYDIVLFHVIIRQIPLTVRKNEARIVGCTLYAVHDTE